MKVAILLPTWVGDTCMATPTIRALRDGLPNVDELCVVGRYAPVAVLEGTPWIDSSIIYKPRSTDSKIVSRRGLVAMLKRRGFNMVVLLPNSLSAGLIGYLSGAKRRIGYAKDGRSWLLTDPIPQWDGVVDHSKKPTIDYYLQIANRLGCSIVDRRMQLFVSDSDQKLAKDLYSRFQFSSESPTVVFNTSSATAASRLWPVGHASRAAKLLADQFGIQIIVHCGPSDRERANAIAFGASHRLVKSMGHIEDIPIGLSKALLSQANVVVSTDSGPRHMAIALDKRVVSLFGPTAPEGTQTYNQPETILQVPMDCQPCGKAKCPLVHNNCMHGLAYPVVVDAVLKLIGISNGSGALEFENRLALPRSAA